MNIFIWIIQILLVPALSPMLIGVTRKIKARFQNRSGASIFQPYKDLWKLFHKDEVISFDASYIFSVAPYIVFATTILAGLSIPLISTVLTNAYTSDLLVVIYVLALGTFFIALSGLDAGSPFGGFASSREMFLASLAEGGLLLSVFAVALNAHTTNLLAMPSAIASMPFGDYFPILIAFIAFLIAMLAETARYPFDNPATHLELTMVHEAMILEYSGKRLALMEWASANKYMIFIVLGANLFFPWGLASTLGASAIALALGVLLLKMIGFCFAVAFIESSMAKFRIFRLPDLLFTSFIISIIAIGLSI